MSSLSVRRIRTTAVCAAALLGAGLLTGYVAPSAESATPGTFALPATGSIKILGHGLGHGHGMSQYGAQGAAMAGLNSSQIIAFYYQHTTLATVSTTTPMRVLISSAGATTTVGTQAGMTLRSASGAVLGPNPLPTSGISRLRLVASGPGLQLQKLVGSTWSAVAHARDLPPQADFRSNHGVVRLYRSDGTSTIYDGTLGAVRSGGSALTINRVGLDSYVAGVVPREMPSSWNLSAVRAQAIAARTFGLYEKLHAGGAYDVCDTDQCQVYGGAAHYSSGGSLLWQDDPAAVSGAAGVVAEYGGAPILAQFSSSDGGWTVDGGLPYLAARADPYDNAATGDPNFSWSEIVPVSRIASAYGLKKATKIEILTRDGHGDWGGRVLTARIDGVDSGSHAKQVLATGFGLQDALGLPHNWFTIDAGVAGAPAGVTATAGDAGATVTWTAPASTGGHAITGYTVQTGSTSISLPASARSAYVGPLTNAHANTVTVSAVNSAGSGEGSTVLVTPTASSRAVRAVNPARLFDTRSGKTRVTHTHPYAFSPGGHASIPKTDVRSVQMALTIMSPTASGTMRVFPAGVHEVASQAIVYIAGHTTTVTVSVPLAPNGKIEFAPSAGSMDLMADQMSYSTTTGAPISPIAPATALASRSIPTGGMTVPLTGVAGVTSTTFAVVLRVAATTVDATGWVQLWQSSVAVPTARMLTVSKGVGSSNLIVVPIGEARAVKIRSSTTDVHASVTVVGVIGSVASGEFEALPVTATADSAAGAARAGASFKATSHAASKVVLGTAQLPATGVSAVLVHVTVVRPTKAGSLWIYKAGSTLPTAPSMYFGSAHSVTATLLVPVSTRGAIELRTSAPTVTVSLDTVGYVTT